MRRSFGHILLMAMLAVFPACDKQGGGTGYVPEQVPVQLALCVRSGGASTKGDVTVIKELQPTPAFSGLADIRLLPFSQISTITAADEALKNTIPHLSVASDGLADVSNACYFGLENGVVFTIPRETASFLVYGKAIKSGDENTDPEVEFKHLNGSLIESGFDNVNPQPASIKFSPDVMLSSSATPEDATTIANALTTIVNGGENDTPFSITAYYDNGKSIPVTVPWDGSIGDDNLRTCFEDITAGGALMPGSGVNVGAMLTNLYRTLALYSIVNTYQYEVEKDGSFYPATKENGEPLTYGDLYRGVRDKILGRFTSLADLGIITITTPFGPNPQVTFTDENVATYPERLGLPSGAAVVRWTPSRYVVPLENGLDGIAPISAYCYPPSMYYFVDTHIRTSDEEIDATLYESDSEWDSILSNYASGTIVTSSTRAVALQEPLHFGVGMLKATIVANADKLQDNDGQDYTLVDVSGTKFPLTGVIIGRQYRQNFDFTPDDDGNSSQCYLYDDRMPELYLTTTQSDEFRTLTLETPEDKDTYFCLEFRNDSGQSFQGAEGRILPGHKFYLVGKLAVPSGSFHKAFTKDFSTKVNCVVKSLKDAHSAVPDMGIPFLTLGVETVVDWTMSEPITLIME